MIMEQSQCFDTRRSALNACLCRRSMCQSLNPRYCLSERGLWSLGDQRISAISGKKAGIHTSAKPGGGSSEEPAPSWPALHLGLSDVCC